MRHPIVIFSIFIMSILCLTLSIYGAVTLNITVLMTAGVLSIINMVLCLISLNSPKGEKKL